MKKYITGMLALSIVLTACEKKVDPIDTFDVTVEYRAGTAKYVTGDITVNPKDSIFFDWIHSDLPTPLTGDLFPW